LRPLTSRCGIPDSLDSIPAPLSSDRRHLKEFETSQSVTNLGRRRESCNNNIGLVGTSLSRRLTSQAEREAEESNRIHREMIESLNANPIAKRKFLHHAST